MEVESVSDFVLFLDKIDALWPDHQADDICSLILRKIQSNYTEKINKCILEMTSTQDRYNSATHRKNWDPMLSIPISHFLNLWLTVHRRLTLLRSFCSIWPYCGMIYRKTHPPKYPCAFEIRKNLNLPKQLERFYLTLGLMSITLYQ